MNKHETCLIKAEVIYLVAFTLWLLNACLRITFWVNYPFVQKICPYLLEFSFVFLIIYFFAKPYTKKDIIGIVLVCVAGIMADKSVYGKELIYCAVFVFFSKDIKLEKIFSIYFLIQGSLLCVTILGARFGIVLNKEFGDSSDDIRYALGYTFATYSSHIFTFLTITWFLIKKNAGIISALILFAFNIILYSQNRGRTDLFVTSWGLIGFLSIRCRRKLSFDTSKIQTAIKRFYILVTILFVLAALGTRFLYYYYPNRMEEINAILTNRPDLEIKAITNYGFSLFGKIIRWVGIGSWEASNYMLTYNYVDNSFLKITLTYGLLTGLFVCLCLSKLLFHYEKNDDFSELIALSCLIMYSLFNAHLLALNIQCVVLLLSSLLKDERQALIY